MCEQWHFVVLLHFIFFLKDTAPTEIYTLPLHDALPISGVRKVVVSGSLSAVGYDPRRPSDESMPFNPFEEHLPYSVTKAFVEHECLKAAVEGLGGGLDSVSSVF